MALAPKTLLTNKYRIETVIGQGAYGRVYRARNVDMDHLVAIKELHRGEGELSSELYQDYVRRFKRESKVQAKFNHPHVVHVYDLLELKKGALYLVMECVEGGNLKEYLEKKGALPLPEVIRLGQEILNGLEHVHADGRDIVHRDIKPSNILLTKEGHVKICDFGLAQVGDESMRTMSGGSQPGTPTYMSPEQGTSSDYLTHKSDLFSMGCVLFEMLIGVLYKHAKRNKKSLRDLRPDAPGWLNAIVEQVLSEDIHARPDTAEAIAEMLKEGWRAETEKQRQAIEQSKIEVARKQREEQERLAREKPEAEARAKSEQAKREEELRKRTGLE